MEFVFLRQGLQLAVEHFLDPGVGGRRKILNFSIQCFFFIVILLVCNQNMTSKHLKKECGKLRVKGRY